MSSLPNPIINIHTEYSSYFDVLNADTPALLDRVYRLRHQVYCVENAFEDSNQHLDGREIDGNDDRSLHTLLIHRDSGTAAGTARVIRPLAGNRARLLPLQGLLSKDGRHAFERLPIETTGEISRFAVSKEFRRRQVELAGIRCLPDANMRDGRSLRPHITFGLIAGILAICREYGITHVCAVMEPALIRLLARIGLHFQAIGDLVDYHGLRQPCVAHVADMVDQCRSQDTLLWQYVSPREPIKLDHSSELVSASTFATVVIGTGAVSGGRVLSCRSPSTPSSA
jgi:N-acyl amino acid synthase of PEP-CTERM/exosortase system